MLLSPCRRVFFFAVAAIGLIWSNAARGTLFQSITGETQAPRNAVINSDGSLTESGVKYVAIYKPSTPPPGWVKPGWIQSGGAYNGDGSIGFEVDPQTPDPNSGTPTDKTQLRVSHAGDASDLVFDNTRFLGFAVKIPSATFSAPTLGVVEIAQWWQGSPYSPPLTLAISGGTHSGANYELLVHNNSTLGNPSSVPVIIGSGSIAFDEWSTFEIKTIMDYDGAGQVELWQNGSLLVIWTGSDAYNPSTIPYKNPHAGTDNPNSAFDVFIGPYRDEQNTEQQEFFDEVRWADTLSDATPIASPVPEPASFVCVALLAGFRLVQRRRALKG